MAAAALPALSSTTQLSRRQPPPGNGTPHQIQPPNLSKSNLSIKQQQPNQPIDPVVSWTSSISRHCRNGRLGQAADLFTQMRLSAVEPNHVTFVTLVSACADYPAEGRSFGRMIHSYLRKLGLDRNHVVVGTALVKMYSKLGELDLARVCFDELEVKNSVSWNTMIGGYLRNQETELAVQLFDEMPQKDAVSWTLLIDGFVKKGLFEEALESFREMQVVAEVDPDYVTVTSVLAACANLGALGLGIWTHRYVLDQEWRNNVRIQNSLIDMYARCGSVELARQVFDKMSQRTLVSWNSMIVGLAANGFAEEALECFEKMRREGFNPDGVSFTGALTACSHAGFVQEGLKYFNLMTKYRISPRIEHYGCMVDLYSRAGNLEAAINIVESMSMKPNDVVLGSLLAACKSHEDVELAERVMNRVVDLEPGVDSNYVILANLYAASGEWEGASKIRRRMKAAGVRKTAGFSSVEVESGIHEFVAGDKSHCEAEGIYRMLELVAFELKLHSQAGNEEVFRHL